MSFRFYIFLCMVAVGVGALSLTLDGAVSADYLRLLALSVTAVLYVQIVNIAIDHARSPHQRFPNWVIWAMGYSYIIVTIEDVGTVVSEFGDPALNYSTLLLAASAGLAELFMYRLARVFGRI